MTCFKSIVDRRLDRLIQQRPILVTGANRSGTTWVGKMLCASRELEYVHEPFNSSNWPRLLGITLGGHYAYICPSNEGEFLQPVTDVLNYRPPLIRQSTEIRSFKEAKRLVSETFVSYRARLRKRTPLIKDPIALFSAPWLADRFNCRVIVMIRHPAAYVSSIRRAGWKFNFRFLLDQDHLMRDLLEPFREEIESMATRPADYVDQAIALWRIKYSVVDRWRTERPDWEFVRYEDLAADPIAGFRSLYGKIGLPFDITARKTIEAFTGVTNPTERSLNESNNFCRNSRAMRKVWRTRLSNEELAHIRERVGPLADRFYDKDDWAD